jgi:hypothetical protein
MWGHKILEEEVAIPHWWDYFMQKKKKVCFFFGIGV